MKKFIKENWFKVVIILIIIVGICVYYFGYFLPQKNQLAMLALQEKCANQAQKFFTDGDRYKDSDGIMFDYKNHFNSKLNKCFILIYASSLKDDFLSIDLFDVLEIKHYASYIGHGHCDPLALSLEYPSNPNKCVLDSGNIWFNGDDTRKADLIYGFEGLLNGSGVGNENTANNFMKEISNYFMNN